MTLQGVWDLLFAVVLLSIVWQLHIFQRMLRNTTRLVRRLERRTRTPAG